MKVCIAEKPSVAREIASVIGANTRRDGYIEGNGYAVTWTFGHFCGLYNPEEYTAEWKKWNIKVLPMLPDKFQTKLINDKGIKKQFGIIKKLFKKATLVINCGDAGQEGELIQRWVIKESKYKGPVERLWISSLTKEAVRVGFNKLQPAKNFDSLYHAGSARAIGDWLLGMNATRLYTLKYGGGKQVLSIGRVQTPTLAMLVARHKEIINFVSTPFWELQTIYRDIPFKYEKGRFTAKEDGAKLLQTIEGKPFTILSANKKKGKEYAPRLFDLTGLQVHCNKRFGFTADQTLKIVQKLYERKHVTYPRVDTTYLPNDVYPKIKGILSKLNQYKEFTTPLLAKAIVKSSRVFNDKKVTDHHAIIPTGVEGNLDYDQQRVYDAITRRFIANFYPPCDVNNTTVIGAVEDIKFKTTGKEIVNPGWKVLYPKSEKKGDISQKGKEEEKVLPLFKPGETGPHLPSLIEKQTQPPKYYTEATLLRAMETAGKTVDNDELRDLMKENGIGRPSTRASIIETLFRRNYAYRSKKNVMPTDLGVQLIDTIQNPLLKSPELTGQWEKKLRMIEAGHFKSSLFVSEMKQMTAKLVKEVRQSRAPSQIDISALPDRRKSGKYAKYKKPGSKPSKRNKVDRALSQSTKAKKKKSLSECVCPKCNRGSLLTGKTAYGCSRYKEGCTFILPFTFKGKKISENQCIRLVTKGATVKLKGFAYGSQKMSGVITFDSNYGLRLEGQPTSSTNKASSARPPSNSTAPQPSCPKCQQGKIIKGKTAYGCTRWKAGCDFTFSFAEIKKRAGNRTLSRALVYQILSS